MEIKGSDEQLLIFLWTLGEKSVSLDLSTQAIIPEGVHYYWSRLMYAWTSRLRVKGGNCGMISH